MLRLHAAIAVCAVVAGCGAAPARQAWPAPGPVYVNPAAARAQRHSVPQGSRAVRPPAAASAGPRPEKAAVAAHRSEKPPLTCVAANPTATYRVRFPAWHTVSDVAVWYASITCRRVVLSRALSRKSIPIEIDALVEGKELDSMLASMLHDVGLVAIQRAHGVLIQKKGVPSGKVPTGADRLVLAPVPAQGAGDAPPPAGDAPLPADAARSAAAGAAQ